MTKVKYLVLHLRDDIQALSVEVRKSHKMLTSQILRSGLESVY